MVVCIRVFTLLPSAGTDGRGDWRATQGLSLWGHRKCQDGVGMEEELAQSETRQCLQALLFSISMSPGACSASQTKVPWVQLGSPIATLPGDPKSHLWLEMPAQAFCPKQSIDRAIVLFFLPEG